MRKKLSEAHMGIRQTPESWKKQQEAWAKKCKTPYSFTSLNGAVYNNIHNLRAFAREHNLGPNGRMLTLLHREKIRYFKGWTKTGVSLPSYQLVSPTGDISKGMILKALCRQADVNYKMVHKYCLKKGKAYQGWMAKQLA